MHRTAWVARGFANRSRLVPSSNILLGLYGRFGASGDFAFVHYCARIQENIGPRMNANG
jgi:hypothetical protein